jgi:N-methylhydantoinase A
MLLGVDVGGTFTDAVLIAGGRLHTAKVPSTPRDQSEGVLAAVRAVLASAGAEPRAVRAFAHGMTVATNALLEGRTARTALIATEGFTDVVELGRQNRAELYRLCARGPAPLVPPELRFPAPERMGPDGALRPLSEQAAAALAARVAAAGPEAVAVVLLHAYRHPQHERLLTAALRRAAPAASVHASHETVGTFREYERAATTELDAALTPLLAGYLRRLGARCREAGLPEPAIMQSDGGLIELEAAASHAVWTLLSGPAGGAAGAALLARAAGARHALCFDMGGTSCDVCVVDEGTVQERGSGVIAGRPVAAPMLAIHTVGAGGGSIAWADAGGALRVGPRSAGADPGPACYARGGREPTVTDANLLLGYLDGARPLAGGVRLDARLAGAAVAALGRWLGLEPVACAEGIRRVAGAEMVRALRVVTVERGIDPRGYALLAFGGAGGLHAAQIAEQLGIRRILCPRAGGVLAALGLIAAPRRREAQRSVVLGGGALTEEALGAVERELAERARAALGEPDAELAATYEVRYRGQSFELPVAAPPGVGLARLRERFEAEHERRYGYRDPEQEIELVTVRLSASVPGLELDLAAAAATGGGGRGTAGGAASQPALERARRRAWIDGQELELAVLRGAPPAGTELAGPAIVELPECTVLVPPGWAGAVDAAGTVALERR